MVKNITKYLVFILTIIASINAQSQPIANFSVSQSSGCAPLSVNFNDLSSGNPTEWKWDFGDGTTSILKNPSIIYNIPGLYTVKLVVKNTVGVDSLIKIQYINVKGILPSQIHVNLPESGCAPMQKSFTVSIDGTPNIAGCLWDFGDGTTSTAINAAHLFNSGIYNIKLTVTNIEGCKTPVIFPNGIAAVEKPIADFTVNEANSCGAVRFQNTSIGEITKCLWNFGDGTTSGKKNPDHLYVDTGYMNVQLTVWNRGCSSKKKIDNYIYIKPPISRFTFTYSCNKPYVRNFNQTSISADEWLWNFGDGTTSIEKNPIHTYQSSGNYRVSLTTKNHTTGCSYTLEKVLFAGVEKANFTTSDSIICKNDTIILTGQSSNDDNIRFYIWDFGDGVRDTGKNVPHAYIFSGNYDIRLITINKSGCADTLIKKAFIKVNGPTAGFTTSFAGVCTKKTLTFNDASTTDGIHPITAWNWDYGDNITEHLNSPPFQHFYNSEGIKKVLLQVIDSHGCTDTISKNIEVYPLPNINAGHDEVICMGSEKRLTATGGDSYIWGPHIRLSCINCSSPIANPDSTINYFVEGTSAYGCKNTDTVQVSVRHPFKMSINNNDTICKGESKQLIVTGGMTYTWTPSIGLNNTATDSPIASPDTTTKYTVIGIDDQGCFKDTNSIIVTVYPLPNIYAEDDKTINAGEKTALHFTHSQDITNVLWTPLSSILYTKADSAVVQPKVTTEYTIEVSNQAGCKATDKITVFVTCNNNNVFIPNTFSPNGDGINDKFYPRGKGLFTIKSLQVFNRSGQIVFEKNNLLPNNENVGWDGTYKGAKAPSDVYIYVATIICESNSTMTFKGNITLIR